LFSRVDIKTKLQPVWHKLNATQRSSNIQEKQLLSTQFHPFGRLNLGAPLALHNNKPSPSIVDMV
jgi:hypothetical protein